MKFADPGLKRSAIFAVMLFLLSNAAYSFSGNPAINDDNQLPAAAVAAGIERDNETVVKRELPQNNDQIPSVAGYIKGFPADLWGGTERIFYRDNLPLAITGFGLTALAFQIDGKAKRESLEDHPLGKWRNIGNTLGDGFVEVAAGGGMFLTGKFIGDRKLADTGAVTLEACLIDGAATEALKYAVGRRRPNGSGDKMSFPSGHTSVTAALAGSVSEMYDWDPGIAVPLYATVALVGISRMDSNMHYLSDVLAGATLGTLVGSSVAKYHKEKASKRKISFFPIYEKDFKAILFTCSF